MMGKLKYIIYTTRGITKPQVVVFNKFIDHLSIARGLLLEDAKIQAAGFCMLSFDVFEGVVVSCHGRALSLYPLLEEGVISENNLKSNQGDSEVIKEALKGHAL